MKYQNCIFDLYGTLADIRTDEMLPDLWEEMTALYREQGADYSQDEMCSGYFRIARQMEQEMKCRFAYPEIKIEEVFRQLFCDKGVDPAPELCIHVGQRFRKSSLEYIRLYDGAYELLKTLRRGGQGVWLLSNAQRIFTEPELHGLGIYDLFDSICLSSDYGCKKPDRCFYNALLQEHSIPTETAIMIGNDAACDIYGAQSVGLSTLYIHTDISPDEPLPKADYVLEEMDMSRVLDILTQK